MQHASAAIAGKETAPAQAFQPVLEAPSSPNTSNGHSDDASTYSMMLARGNACLRMVDVSMQLKGSTVLYNTVHLAQGLLRAVQDYAATHPGFMPPQHFRELMDNLEVIKQFKDTFGVTWGTRPIEEKGEGQLTEMVTIVYNWASGRPRLLVSDEPRLEDFNGELVSRVQDVKTRQHRSKQLSRRDLQLLLAVAIHLDAMQRILQGCFERRISGTVENLFIQLFDEFNVVMDRLPWCRCNPFAVVGDGALENLQRFTTWVVEAAQSGEHIPILQGRVEATKCSYRRIDEMFEEEVITLENNELAADQVVENVAVAEAEPEEQLEVAGLCEVSEECLEVVSADLVATEATIPEMVAIAKPVVTAADLEQDNACKLEPPTDSAEMPASVYEIAASASATIKDISIGEEMEQVVEAEEEILSSEAISEEITVASINAFKDEVVPEAAVEATDAALNVEDVFTLVDPCLDEEEEKENELVCAVLGSSADLRADYPLSSFTAAVPAVPAVECEEAVHVDICEEEGHAKVVIVDLRVTSQNIKHSDEGAAAAAPLALFENVEESAMHGTISLYESVGAVVLPSHADSSTFIPLASLEEVSEEVASLIGDMLDTIQAEVEILEAKASDKKMLLSEEVVVTERTREGGSSTTVVSLQVAENLPRAKVAGKVNEVADENAQPAGQNFEIIVAAPDADARTNTAALVLKENTSRTPLVEIASENTVPAAKEYAEEIMEERATQEVQRVEEIVSAASAAILGVGTVTASNGPLSEAASAASPAVGPASGPSAGKASSEQPESMFIKIVRGVGHALATVAAVVTTGWGMVCRFMCRRR